MVTLSRPFLRGKLGLLIALLLLASKSVAQSSEDSLLATFQAIKDDSSRLDSMNEIAFQLGFSDPVLALSLIESTEAEAKSLGQSKLHVSAILTRGSIYFNLGIFDVAFSEFWEALQLANMIGFEGGQAAALNNIGNIQERQQHYREAIESYRKARQLLVKLGRKKSAVIVLTNIANGYIGLREYDRAITICDSALIEIDDPNDARSFSLVYGFLGESYQGKGDYPNALRYANLKMAKAKESADDFAQIEALIIRGKVNSITQQLQAAKEDVQQALQLADVLQFDSKSAECYSLLADISKKAGAVAEALAWMEKSKALTDSIQDEESKTALANFQALYEVNQKDAQIELLNKDKEIQDTKLLNAWYLVGLISVAFLAMLMILAVLLRNNKARRRINLELQGKNQQILQQNEQISLQNAALSSQNEQLNILNHEMAGLLHVVAHDLKAPLTQVSSLIGVVEEEGNLSPSQQKMLKMAQKVTNNASNLVKDLVELGSAEQAGTHLQKIAVPLKSLVSEIAAAFVAEATRKSIKLDTDLPEAEVVVQTEPNHLRRVLENLISNALKFSPSGKTVDIALAAEGNRWRISIHDQGPGISPADQKNLYRKFHKLSARPTAGESSSGLGLAIVKTLVDQLGGEITLASEVGVGSTFEVRIPG